MHDSNARRDRRYAFELPVTLLSSRGDHEATTADVSYRGVFLRASDALPKLRLVRARLKLPTQAAALEANLVVANVGVRSSGASGMGAAFYGLEGKPRQQWEAFIRFVEEQQRTVSATQPARARLPEIGERGAQDDGSVDIMDFEESERAIAHAIVRTRGAA